MAKSNAKIMRGKHPVFLENNKFQNFNISHFYPKNSGIERFSQKSFFCLSAHPSRQPRTGN